MKNSKGLSVYVDTNVIRNFFTGQKSDVNCLRYLFSVRRREKLFTSTLAVAQVLSGIQKSGKNRKGFTKETTIEKGNYILQKFSIVDFFGKDLPDIFELPGKDVEDNMHYLFSQRKKCTVFITNDDTDFAIYGDLTVVKPKELAYLKKIIN